MNVLCIIWTIPVKKKNKKYTFLFQPHFSWVNERNCPKIKISQHMTLKEYKGCYTTTDKQCKLMVWSRDKSIRLEQFSFILRKFSSSFKYIVLSITTVRIYKQYIGNADKRVRVVLFNHLSCVLVLVHILCYLVYFCSLCSLEHRVSFLFSDGQTIGP